MKILIASDIHGDYDCARKMIDAFLNSECDEILILGDILYHGPRNDLPAGYNPKKVIELLNGYKDKITAVRGNCDAEVDQMVLDFPIRADYVKLVDGDVKMFATHGHIFEKTNLPKLAAGEHFLQGHTHLITNEELENGGRILNPGSVSIPKGGNPNSYMIYESGQVTCYTLEGEKIFVQSL